MRSPDTIIQISSHYSKSTNVCWVKRKIFTVKKDGTFVTEFDTILDGFENITHGVCARKNNNETWNTIPNLCWAGDADLKERKKFSDGVAWDSYVNLHYFAAP